MKPDRGAGEPSALLPPTKYFVPVVDEDAVERRRLLDRLDEGRRARLLLISAPAGSGKTTLVAQWVRQLPEATCWISLEAGDDDPVAFLGYLVDAVHALGHGWCDRTQALVRSGAPPEPEVVARALLAELTETGACTVVVLDDYHVMNAPSVHGLLTRLVEGAPAAIRFVLITRHDPPLPLARLRGRGHLVELRASDLRFELAEAGELTARLSHRTLRPDSLAALAARTEGWAAGLQLAALALRQARDPDAFVADFTGTHVFIADYLADEVLATIPHEEQQFLLRTAVLQRLSAPLCDAVLERTDSQGRLLALHRANLFLVPLDDERRWFRYHHLFADLLRRRDRERSADDRERLALLGRAAAWCEANDALDDAIGYAMQAGDTTRAADLVARHGVGLLVRGQGVTLLRWLRALPDDVVRCSPDHCVLAAWALTLMQVYDPVDGLDDREVERKGAVLATTPADPIGGYARRALEMLAADRRAFAYVPNVAQHARVLLASADGADGPEAAVQALEDARDDIPPDDHPLRAAAELRIGERCTLVGHYERGLAAHARAHDAAVLCGSELLRLSAVTGRAWILLLQGRLRELLALVEPELAGREALRESLGTYVGNLHAWMAAAHAERGDLALTEHHLQRAWAAFGASRAQADGWRTIVRFAPPRPRASHLTVHAVRWACFAQLRLLIRQGAWRDTMRHLDELEASLPTGPNPDDRIMLDAARTLARVAAGDRARLRDTLRGAPIGRADSVHWGAVAHLSRARAALAAGEGGTSRSLLQSLTDGRSLAGMHARVLDASAATSLDAAGRAAAAAQVAEVLERTSEEAWLAPWLEAGHAALEPLEAVVRAGDVSASAQSLAAVVIAQLRGGMAMRSDGGAILSERERTVLRLLAAGHTNQQIAETLFLAVGSVKKHTHNIFTKLGVRTRTQAAQRAREQGLLH